MNKFWLENPRVLLNIPDFPYGFIDKLNFIFVLSIVISIVLIFLFGGDLKFIVIAILIGFITILLKNRYDSERFQQQCIIQKKNNPFNNPTIYDKSDRAPCVDPEKSDQLFYENTFQEYDDIYQTGLSRRQFYTIPGPTIPNDRETLANWLYNSHGSSCKQGNTDRCLKNINLHRTDVDKIV